MGTDFSARTTQRTRIAFGGTEVPATIELPEEWQFFGFNQRTAGALFRLFAGAYKPAKAWEPQYGTATIPEVRRAVMASRARFESVAPSAIGIHELIYNPRIIESEFGIDDLKARLERFAAFVEICAESGADHIVWS
jgi:hypothetical protein